MLSLLPQNRFVLPAMLGSVAIMAADQLSKWWVVEKFLRISGEATAFAEWLFLRKPHFLYGAGGEFTGKIICPNLNAVLVWNRGVSFGLLSSHSSYAPLILSVLAALISIWLFAWLTIAVYRHVAFALSLIIGGALSNVLDRLRFGAVVDFIDVHAAGYHWPAFNIADSAIVVGAAILFLDAALLHQTPSAEKRPY